MYFYGSFLTQSGETVTVHVVTNNSRDKQIEIGDEKSGVFFTDNPVVIESCVNDTFDHLLRSQATIRLLTRDFIPDFFCTSCMDAVVNIFKGDKCIFAGFIEPQAYSQGYNEAYDELEISCIDVLSALQYSKYRDVSGPGVLYDAVKAEAGQRTFKELIADILNNACNKIDISGHNGTRFFYDGSKAVDNNNENRYKIFGQLSIAELLFLGNDEDDVWQKSKVLEAILKYLNLHIVQDGLNFYIFTWESVKNPGNITWQELETGGAMTTGKNTVEISLENTAAADTTISIGEVFNRILLTCKIECVENVIESPLDDDALTSPYSNRQKYMTEYSSDGEGERAYRAFYAMTHGNNTDYSDGVITHWFLQVKDNPMWIFPEKEGEGDLIDKYCQNNTDQQSLPNHLYKNPGAAIISLGKIDDKTNHKDNSPINKIDMTDYLVVSVNGNGIDNIGETYPDENSLKAGIPCAIYNGGTTGGIYSPSDEKAKNYIVLSGKVVLSPVMDFTKDYKYLHDSTGWDRDGVYTDHSIWHKTVYSRKNKDGRYYTQQYHKAATPFDDPVWDEDTARGLVPFTDTGRQMYEFKYSAVGDGTDKISKVAVLACMLVIGDKCVVETGTSGRPSDFKWMPYKTREQCSDDDEYYQQCFTVGFDPKIGDKLIGTEFSLQNNIDYEMGINATGIAIPIQKDDRLSGPVKFMILGPVNSLWGDITRRHPTFFRHTKWTEKSIPLLAHVSNIFLKAFEIKIYSDNGLINNSGDNDIIYMSDTRETFANPKDDIEFEINSALTLSECQELGVNDSVRMSTPSNLHTGYAVSAIYDHATQRQAKPEQLYVDSYYTEYHKPRILMTHKLNDKISTVGLFNHYIHPAMPEKKFYVLGITRNLIEGWAELTIKETW